MCDPNSENDAKDFTPSPCSLERREFIKLMAAGTVALTLSDSAIANQVSTSDVLINTADGTADAFFARPNTGQHPAVIMWTDIKGMRPAFKAMAERLATSGYAVLLVNPFYRDVKGKALPESFPSPEAWSVLRTYRDKLDETAIVSDCQAFIEFLDKQTRADSHHGIATLGYCMSGVFALWAAQHFPQKVTAIATFHGGGLAKADPDSPHHGIKRSQARALHAIAEKDHEKDPQMAPLLTRAYQEAGLLADIKIYPGTQHGWTPPDSHVYDDVQAEMAWQDLLNLLSPQ